MSAFILITGILFRNPEWHTSKAGKPYVTATLRAKDGEESQWWKAVAFAESAQAELMRLGEGDSISIYPRRIARRDVCQGRRKTRLAWRCRGSCDCAAPAKALEGGHAPPKADNSGVRRCNPLVKPATEVARQVLDNMMRILAMPVPSPNDTSAEAQLVRALMLAVAGVVLDHAGAMREIAAFGTVH